MFRHERSGGLESESVVEFDNAPHEIAADLGAYRYWIMLESEVIDDDATLST